MKKNVDTLKEPQKDGVNRIYYRRVSLFLYCFYGLLWYVHFNIGIMYRDYLSFTDGQKTI